MDRRLQRSADEADHLFEREPIPDLAGPGKSGPLAVAARAAVITTLVVVAAVLTFPRNDHAVTETTSVVTVSEVTATAPTTPSTTEPSPGPAGVQPIEPGPLEGRVGHTVVWTGAEVVIWGGYRDGLSSNDGAAYDPVSGTWRRIATPQIEGMTWHYAAWSGREMFVVGPAGAASYDPALDSWRPLPPPPFPILTVTENGSDVTVYAWSGKHLYIWNPVRDEMARLDSSGESWEIVTGPALTAFPAKLLARGDRLLAFGTRWPGGGAGPATYDLLGAELIEGTWFHLPPVNFISDQYANVADPGTASFFGESVIVWGDPSPEPGNAWILHRDRSWSVAPPPPIDDNVLHPEPVALDDGRVLALSEGGNAAIWEPVLLAWTPIGPLPAVLGAREAVWTGREVIAWSGSGGAWRWTPPAAPAEMGVPYDKGGNTHIGSACPGADPLLRGNPDGLPRLGQTEKDRVRSLVESYGDALVGEWSAVDILVIPRNGQVWREGDSGEIESIQVDDYQIELVLGPDSPCPSAPYFWNGIPVLFTRGGA